MDNLKTLLHTVPQELYDQIYHEVFIAPAHRVRIETTYRPPHLFSVSSASRSEYAKSYYTNTIFICDNDIILRRWLHGVAAAGHLHLLGEVRFMNRSLLDPCVWRFQGPFDSTRKYRRSAAKRAAFCILCRLRINLKEGGVPLMDDVLRVEQHFMNDDAKEDVVVC